MIFAYFALVIGAVSAIPSSSSFSSSSSSSSSGPSSSAASSACHDGICEVSINGVRQTGLGQNEASQLINSSRNLKITSINGPFVSRGFRTPAALTEVSYEGDNYDFWGNIPFGWQSGSGTCCVRTKKAQSNKCQKEGGCCAPCTIQTAVAFQ